VITRTSSRRSASPPWRFFRKNANRSAIAAIDMNDSTNSTYNTQVAPSSAIFTSSSTIVMTPPPSLSLHL